MSHSYPTAATADIVDRLASLRAILPLIAADLAAARRRANKLEVENRRLTGRIAELESKLAPGGAQARRRPPDTSARSLTKPGAFGAESTPPSAFVSQRVFADRAAGARRAGA